MLQQDEPEDYVIATDETHSVRECVEIAFDEAGLGDWERYVEIDPSLRAARPRSTTSSATTSRPSATWAGSRTTSFEELIRLMTRADLELLSR